MKKKTKINRDPHWPGLCSGWVGGRRGGKKIFKHDEFWNFIFLFLFSSILDFSMIVQIVHWLMKYNCVYDKHKVNILTFLLDWLINHHRFLFHWDDGQIGSVMANVNFFFIFLYNFWCLTRTKSTEQQQQQIYDDHPLIFNCSLIVS